MQGLLIVFGVLILDALFVKGLTFVGFTQITAAIIVVGGSIGMGIEHLGDAIIKTRSLNHSRNGKEE